MLIREELEKVLGISRDNGERSVDYRSRIVNAAYSIISEEEWDEVFSQEARDWLDEAVVQMDYFSKTCPTFPDEVMRGSDHTITGNVKNPKNSALVQSVVNMTDFSHDDVEIDQDNVKIDEHGYSRVEAFLDAVIDGGTKLEILRKSQLYFIASGGFGEKGYILLPHFYYNVLQRLCYRLGILEVNKEDKTVRLNESFAKKIRG